jgi:hypothetical protein
MFYKFQFFLKKYVKFQFKRAVRLQHKPTWGFRNGDAVHVDKGNCSAAFLHRAVQTGRMRDAVVV